MSRHDAMGLRQCPSCESRLQPVERYCHHCGRSLGAPPQRDGFGLAMPFLDGSLALRFCSGQPGSCLWSALAYPQGGLRGD